MINNNKGDMISVLYVIVIVVTIGIMVFFINHFFFTFENEVYGAIDSNPSIDQTNETKGALNDIIQNDEGVWDYAFLGIALGYVLLIFIFSWQTPINPIFFWISSFLALLWLFIGTVLSNVWGGIASQPALADSLARFPIMNAMLGSYYPTIVTFILIMSMIILFGKPFGGRETI